MSLENPSLNQESEAKDNKKVEARKFFISETDSQGNIINKAGKDFFISESSQNDAEQASKVLDDIKEGYIESAENVNQEDVRAPESKFFVSEETKTKKKSFTQTLKNFFTGK